MPRRLSKPRKKWEIVRKWSPLPEEHPFSSSHDLEYTVRVHRNGFEKIIGSRLVPRAGQPVLGTG
jgi:hypothetical protein